MGKGGLKWKIKGEKRAKKNVHRGGKRPECPLGWTGEKQPYKTNEKS